MAQEIHTQRHSLLAYFSHVKWLTESQLYNRDAQTLTTMCYFRKIFMPMYKGKLSLYTPNTVASHDTCNGLRKSHGMVNVIRHRGSTSGSDLSAGFAGPLAPYLFYTVNKHKWMTVNTLIVTNPFLTILKSNKMKYLVWQMLYKMCRPSNKGVKCLPVMIHLVAKISPL